MPYSLQFRKVIEIAARDEYINECCVGGDIVLRHLWRTLETRYPGQIPQQEDWGWFIWIDRDRDRMAVDVFTHDSTAGEFEVHLTASRSRFLRPREVRDTPELDVLCDAIARQLEAWPVAGLEVERVDAKYMPLSDTR